MKAHYVILTAVLVAPAPLLGSRWVREEERLRSKLVTVTVT